MKNNDFLLLDKANLKTLTIKDISIPFPNLKDTYEPKSLSIANWLIQWIEKDLAAGKIHKTNLLPKKAEFAYHLGVSIGTVQNAIRYVEDKGFVESKQCIGTMICNPGEPSSSIRKLTSKRDLTVEAIKKFIVDNKIKIGEKLPSSRALAKYLGTSSNTTRLALEHLCHSGVIVHNFKNANDSNWVVKSDGFSIEEEKLNASNSLTLVKKIEQDLENYIQENLSVGEKIPPHDELSRIFKVSVKTVHDGLKSLVKKGILLTRRGRYGTTVIKLPYSNEVSTKKESMIFAPAKDTAFYNYEKTQNHIKALIAKEYEIGSKLPSILELSRQLDLSPNTIRRAFNNLADEGYLRFSRGRYGGTFVVDIPDTSASAFKWLAVNPKYVEAYKAIEEINN